MSPPAPFQRRPGRWPYLVAGFTLLVSARWTWDSLHPGPIDPTTETIPPGHYTVRKIRDDGRLEVFVPCKKSKRERWIEIRLLGIDIADGSAVAAEMSELIGQQPVRLQFDRRRLDADGILLAYVFVNDQLINAELVRRGLAQAATHPSDFGPLARRINRAN